MPSEWQFLVSLNEQLRLLKDPNLIQDAALRLLGEHLGVNRALYVSIKDNEWVDARGYTAGVMPFPRRGSMSMWPPPLVQGYRRGETLIVDDIAGDERISKADQQLFAEHAMVAFVGVPLIKDGRWVAAFGVHNAAPRSWTADQVALIELTAQRLWGLGERARVEGELDQSVNRLIFLQRLNETIRPLADPEAIIRETCRLLADYLHVERVGYGEIDGEDCVMVAEYLNGLPAQPRRFHWGDLGSSRTKAILEGGTLFVNDTATEPHTPEERAALQAAGIGAYITPLLVKDGRFVGAFGIHSRAARRWTREEVAIAEDVADRVWATLEHRRAEAGLRANQQRLAFLLRLNDSLRGLADPAEVQTAASRLLAEHLGCTRCGYAETQGGSYVIRHEHTRGVTPLAGPSQDINVGVQLRAALNNGDTLIVADIETDPRLREAERATMRSRQIAAFVGVALFRHDRMVAVFGANHNAPRQWTAAEAELVRDVAERTWDAVERTRAEVALVEQKRRLQLALDASGGGSWTWDAASNEVHWDARFRELYDFDPDEAAATDKWVPRVHEDDRAALLADLTDIMTSTTRASWQNTFRVARADGSVRWVQSRGHVERDRDGRLTRLTGLDLDFTQHHLAEAAMQSLRDQEHHQALQARTDELEYRTTQLSRMASDLTLAEQRAREQIAKNLHDGLQQLLVIVAVNLERQIKRDHEHGVAPSEQVLDAQRHLDEAIAAARSLNFELFPPVLTRSGLPAAFTWLAGWAHDKYQLDVQTKIDARADSSRKDVRTLLFESVRELLLNAVKHAKASRVTLELSLDGADQLVITVADDGAGFDRTRLDERSKAGQAGWGLFSIRERLTLLGGEFSIDSAPGQGTRVCLIAPRAPALEAVTAPGSGLLDAEPAANSGGNAYTNAIKILIVDDHSAMRAAVRGMLQERRELLIVGEAANGVEGIAQAHALKPDVILMDVAMPHMDGVEATRRIRAELPAITIVGLSTHTRGESAEAMEQAGAAAFFVKGVDTGQLIDYLMEAYASRQAGSGARTR